MISKKRLFRIQAALTVLFSIAVIGGCIGGYWFGFFRLLDNYIYDSYFKIRGPIQTSGKIAIVMMDEQSARELKRQESWPREATALALANLTNAGAEIIGLDMLLIAPSYNREADELLANVIHQCNNIVLANTSTVYGHGERMAAMPIFREGMIGDGFIDLNLDKGDEILRRINYLNVADLKGGGVELFPSFSLELVRAYLYLDFVFDFSKPDYTILGAENDERIILPRPSLIINFPGDHSAYPILSYSDIVNENFDPELVKGKIVIIGSGLPTEKDLFTTPYTRFQDPTEKYGQKFGKQNLADSSMTQKEFGVVCHAHIVETILSQKYISRLPESKVILLIIIIGLIGLLFYLPKIGMFFESVLLCGGVVLLFFTGYELFLQKLLWMDIAPMIGILVAQFVAGIVLQKAFDKRRTDQIKSLFGRYVSPGIVDELIKEDVQLEGVSTELTIFFTDLRGFTTVSEQLGAKDTGFLLNSYFSAMIPVVFKYDGTLDKLMGDAIMAFFGAPVHYDDHPIKAAEAALDMRDSLRRMRDEKEIRGIEHLHAGFGVNTGIVTVGNLGSDEFMDYTIVGDAVNLASRLEGLTKHYAVEIILSQFTANRLDDQFVLRELDLVQVKGKRDIVTLYELMGYRESLSDETIEAVQIFKSALSAYRKRDWGAAVKNMNMVLEIVPGDKVSKIYLERIEHLKRNPPEEDWIGVITYDHK